MKSPAAEEEEELNEGERLYRALTAAKSLDEGGRSSSKEKEKPSKEKEDRDRDRDRRRTEAS